MSPRFLCSKRPCPAVGTLVVLRALRHVGSACLQLCRLPPLFFGLHLGPEMLMTLFVPVRNLMLRDGMLSPYSKLLPQTSRAPSPFDNRASMASHGM